MATNGPQRAPDHWCLMVAYGRVCTPTNQGDYRCLGVVAPATTQPSAAAIAHADSIDCIAECGADCENDTHGGPCCLLVSPDSMHSLEKSIADHKGIIEQGCKRLKSIKCLLFTIIK